MKNKEYIVSEAALKSLILNSILNGLDYSRFSRNFDIEKYNAGRDELVEKTFIEALKYSVSEK